jgi:hypothetical protein
MILCSRIICGGNGHPDAFTAIIAVTYSQLPGCIDFARLSLVSEPQIIFAVDITPIWNPVSSIFVVNMLKGERAGGDCINYTNVAY